jgi:hypothetical protein
LLAEFRADFGHTFRDPRVKAFIEELKAESTLFARFLDRMCMYRTAVSAPLTILDAAGSVSISTASVRRSVRTSSWCCWFYGRAHRSNDPNRHQEAAR